MRLDSDSRERLESCMLQYHKATACAREAMRWKPPDSVEIFRAKRHQRLLLHFEQAKREQESQKLCFIAEELENGGQGITAELDGENEGHTIEVIDSDLQSKNEAYAPETQGRQEKRPSPLRLAPKREAEDAKKKTLPPKGIYVIFSRRKVKISGHAEVVRRASSVATSSLASL